MANESFHLTTTASVQQIQDQKTTMFKDSLYGPGAMPVELLQLVLQQMPHGQLFKICTISRAFHKEVIYALYRDVDLSGVTICRWVSWFNRIIDRPDLARRVRTFTLPGSVYCSDTRSLRQNFRLSPEARERQRFTTQLSSALKLMTNLTVLVLVKLPTRRDRDSTSERWLRGDYFLGCPFRLKTFRMDCDVMWAQGTLLPFLLEQDEIQDFQVGKQGGFTPPSGPVPPPPIFPQLSVASTFYEGPFIFKAIASRQLTRLKLQMLDITYQQDIVDAMHALAPASATLTHLDLYYENYFRAVSEAHHIQTLGAISSALPNLKFLCYDALGLVSNLARYFVFSAHTLVCQSQPLGTGVIFPESFPHSNHLTCWS
ncbi:hypothetical protein HWV62_42024 [Athelia sp. TMB]|nr:hypothetical protein HWV62_42024 [Athelia sp. TMB]